MASFLSGNVQDRDNIPVVGAQVYIYDKQNAGSLAALVDAASQPVGQPVTSGEDGFWSAYAPADGYYDIHYHWAGQQRFIEANKLVGVVTGTDLAQSAATEAMEYRDEAREEAEQTAADRLATDTAKDVTLAAINADDGFTSATIASAITAGLAAVAEAEFFYATGDDVDYVGLYQDISGSEVEIARIPKVSYVTGVADNLTAEIADRKAADDAVLVAVDDATADSKIDVFLNPVSGSDASDGLTRTTALATLSAARTQAQDDETIGVNRGGRIPAPGVGAFGEDIRGYGPSLEKIIMDGRQSLAGKTWVQQAGGSWKTTATLTDLTVPNGTANANTTYFGLWFGSLFADWKVGGADIAANVADVEAVGVDEFAFAVNLQGSTQQDARSDTASTGPFEIYAKFPGEIDPNGQETFFSDRSIIGQFSGRTFRDVKFIGHFGKDAMNVTDFTDPVTLINCEIEGGGSHAQVGPYDLYNYKATGAPRPGMDGFAQGRASGGGIHMFNGTFNSDQDRILEGAEVNNFGIGLYCHGSGNQCYRKWLIREKPVTVNNARFGLRCDPTPGTLLPMFSDGILSTTGVDFLGVDDGFSVDGFYEILGGGKIVFTKTPISNTTLVTFTGAETYLHLKNYEILGQKDNSAGFVNRLCVRNTPSSFSTPTLILDGVTDTSTPAARFVWVRGASPANNEQSHLILKGGTQLWDLADAANRVNFPASLTVGPGCRFGWGNRTRADLRTALDTAGVAHDISDDTTIVGTDGSVLSAPA